MEKNVNGVSLMKTSIKNQYLTLTVDTHGAEPVSVLNNRGEEMLWQADRSVWGRHAPILFPWTGKLSGGSFTHNGKRYEGGQHGFARDLEHRLVRTGNSSIIMELKANEETMQLFPFDFTLTSTFTLKGKSIVHSLKVTNNGAEPMRFGLGYHPAFNVPFDSRHDTEDYEFRFEKAESPLIIDTRPNGLLSGKCYYKWKNTDKIQLTDDLFSNDSFCMAGLRSATLGIYEKDSGRHITCDISGLPYALIWSAITEKIRFVCIEPWHSLPCAENDPQEWNEHAAAATLMRGESYTATLTTCFER